MATKKKTKTNYAVIVDCEYANVLDTPEIGAPLVCQLTAGTNVKKLSKASKGFVEVEVSHSVTGFVEKKYVK